MTKKMDLFLSFLAMILISSSSHAWDTSWPRESEMGGLPEMCLPLPFMGGRGGTYDLNSPIWQKWKPVLGDGYDHTHHYCNGLNMVRRADKAFGKPDDKHGYINQAIGEYTYVITHAPETYALIPEIFLQRGRAYLRLKDSGKAILDFQKAIKLKPSYAAPYSALIDLYIEQGRIKEAKETLAEGLEIMPDSKSLIRRQKQLMPGK